MKIHHSIQKISLLLFASIFAGLWGMPSMAHAVYVWNGRSFDTYSEYQEYIVDYMRAWREVYGTDMPSSNRPSTSIYTTSKSSFEIKTGFAKDITKNTARLVGKISFGSAKEVKIHFEYGEHPDALYFETAPEHLSHSRGSSEFDRKLTTLKQNTTYYYRAVGVHENGAVSHGTIHSFETSIDPSADTALVRVGTGSAKLIDERFATLTGTINFRNARYAYIWFEYGDEINDLYLSTTKTIVYPRDGTAITAPVRNLHAGTEYYYRIVAKDEYGDITYGRTTRFKTKNDIVNEKPILHDLHVTDMDTYSAVLHGSVDMNDFNDGTVFFLYGESSTDVQNASKQYSRYSRIHALGDDLQKILLDNDLDSYDSFSTRIIGLDFDTRYYYAIGVEYENIDGDDVLLISRTQSFQTKKL